MTPPDKLVLTKSDYLECWEDNGHRGCCAYVETDLDEAHLLSIQEWCEQARAWMKERKEEKK